MFNLRTGCMMFFGSVFGLTLAATGCTATTDEAGAPEEAVRAASFAATLVRDPNFAGNSVKICGHRATPADGKYPCDDGWVKTPDGLKIKDVCECFTFPGDWNNGDQTRPEGFKNLCPSNDVGEKSTTGEKSKWWFGLEVYNDTTCGKSGGVKMTDGPDNRFNFVCFEKEDLKTRYSPNEIHEFLEPGKNVNEIICITRNASKEFNFDVCVDESERGDKSKLNCGCDLNHYTYACECKSQPGVSNPTLPKGYKFDDRCNLVMATYL